MESNKPAPKPRYSAVDQMTFRTIVRVCAATDIVGIITIILLRYFDSELSVPLVYSILTSILLAIGFLYCLFGWSKLNKKSPLIAINLAFLPLSMTIMLATFLTGGLDSAWYSLWYVIIVVSGMTGTLSVVHISGLTLLLYSLNMYFYGGDSTLGLGTMVQAIATLVAIVAAYLIGKGMDRMVDIMQIAESLTKQLDGTDFKQQLMLGAIADAVVAVDCERKVVIFNAAAEKLTDWDEKSAKGIDYNVIFKLRDQNDAELTPATDPYEQAMASGQHLNTDQYYMLDKNNRKIAFSISVAPTKDAYGEVTGAIGVFHDISEQKAVARERNEFISTASHEMRTPVAAIEGYLSMAMNPQLANIDERAKNFIEKAHDASIHLGKLFRDLLSVTKIEDRRLTIKIGRFNLTDLLRSVVTEMEIIARTKNIKIDSPFTRETEAGDKLIVPAYEVRADPDRIREVISNLMDNAVKYSQPNSTIVVDIGTNHNFAQVSITDSGIGIAAEDQKHLFQKFYRVNNTFTREVGGTGLGLYIARNLIELFGGKIWLDSEEGKGSAFHFTLPLEKHRSV